MPSSSPSNFETFCRSLDEAILPNSRGGRASGAIAAFQAYHEALAVDQQVPAEATAAQMVRLFALEALLTPLEDGRRETTRQELMSLAQAFVEKQRQKLADLGLRQ